MEAIFCNPGYHLISEKILSTLDHETLMSCKEALHHRRTLLSDPTFWIQKCFDQGLQYDFFFHWKQLIQITTGTYLEENVTYLLIEMHREAPCSFHEPIILASKSEDFELVRFMIKNMTELVQIQLENTELHPIIRRIDNFIWHNIHSVPKFIGGDRLRFKGLLNVLFNEVKVRRRDYKNFEYLTGYHDLTPLQLVVKYNEWDLVMDLMPILPYNLKKYYHPIKYDLF